MREDCASCRCCKGFGSYVLNTDPGGGVTFFSCKDCDAGKRLRELGWHSWVHGNAPEDVLRRMRGIEEAVSITRGGIT